MWMKNTVPGRHAFLTWVPTLCPCGGISLIAPTTRQRGHGSMTCCSCVAKGQARQRAATAAAAYLEGAESRQDTDLDVTMFLVRAWELARRVGDWALAAGVCEKLVERAGGRVVRQGPAGGDCPIDACCRGGEAHT